ncbi:SHIRT domain-containing protein [Amedibacillus dolichus]|uniref:SHIRT domain-containing protein n=3 Tax=Amedibacillus dolichus TaxID=31971 RepID=UPI00374CD89A
MDYKFESTNTDKELPKEIIDKLPTAGSVEHGKTVNAPSTKFDDVKVTDGVWSFKGWTPVKYENVTGNVEFVGKWEFKVNQYVIDYKFESTNTDKELPKEIIDKLPTAGSVEHGKTVNAPSTKFDDVKVTDGVWSFKGWTPVKYENVTGNVEFVGKWEFKKNASIINHIPTISASDKTLTVGDTFDPLKDVLATDKEDGDLTKEIEILKNEVNTSKAGVYEVTYKVTDSKGASSIKTIYVTVNPKMEELNRIPTISASDKTLTVGDTFDPLKDVTARDKEDGDIPLKEENVIKNEVNTSKAGVYEVTYKVTDSKGASSIKTIKVTVIEKNIPIIPNEPDKPSKPDTNKPEDNGSVGTGDKTNGVFWTMLSIICGISVIGVYRKKREINQ